MDQNIEECIAEGLAEVEARLTETIKRLLSTPPANPPMDNLDPEPERGSGSRPSNPLFDGHGKQPKGSWGSGQPKVPLASEQRKFIWDLRTRSHGMRSRILEMESSDEDDQAASPFSDVLMMNPVPTKFNMSNLDHYNGEGDPEEHIIRFESAFPVWDLRRGFCTRLLFSTFRRSVLRWFTNLAPYFRRGLEGRHRNAEDIKLK